MNIYKYYMYVDSVIYQVLFIMYLALMRECKIYLKFIMQVFGNNLTKFDFIIKSCNISITL